MSDPEIKAAAEAIFDELLSDLILTTATKALGDIKRSRIACGTCGTKCRGHLPLVITQPSQTAGSSSSRAPSPSTSQNSQPESRTAGYQAGPEKGTGGSTGIGSGSGRIDGSGNAFFDCLVCGRATVSNKYAQHLASCLGLGGSMRRGAARSAAAKVRLGTNDRSSPSPFVGGSDNGDSDNESVSSKKSKLLSGSAKKPSPKKTMLKKHKSYPSSVASSPNPSHRQSVGPGPSRLGRPPKNAGVSSPPVSPANTVISVQGSTDSSRTGMTNEKRPPPGYSAPIDISMEEDDPDDDY